MQQRVLFAAVDGEVVVAALATVHKLEVDVLADALQVAVMPGFKGEGGGLAAAFVDGPLVAAAGGVGIDRVGRAEGDVDVAAVGLPAGLAGGEVLVRVGDAAVVLFAEFVLRGVRIRIAAQPEILDEGVPLLVVRERLEGLALFVGNNVGHVLVQPGLVGALQLLFDGPLGGELLLVGTFALEGVNFLALCCGLGLWRCRGRVGRLLGHKPGCGGEYQAATQCDEEKTTTVERHCLENSCEPLFYGSRKA